jgi:molecular chaperone GrpE
MSKKKHQKPSDDETPRTDETETDALQEASSESETPLDPIEALGKERDDLLGRLQRVSADYANYQKRARRDLEQSRVFANEGLLRSLLPVLDDMERALDAARENHGEDDPFYKGMELVHDRTLETLRSFGLALVEAEGMEFDPEHHTAMMQQPTTEHPPHRVLQVIQKGYALKGRTIRPAAVVVSTTPQETDAETPPDTETSEDGAAEE